MRLIAEIIHTAFGLYGLGLIAYVLLSWVNHPQASKARIWLGRFYVSILDAISKKVTPVEIKPGVRLDLSPVIFLFAITILRSVVIFLLIPRF